ncbi:MAG: D-cysteine desulfhydrase [Candidatus Azotimanducaceae bacterium]|jgi:D-cysteine desulfhydrase
MPSIKINAPRISLARLPTPLQPLERFCKKHNLPPIWIKRDDLTDAAASGNKLRKLEFNVAEALRQGATTLITCGGIQSNHCRATAIVAASLGLKCHLLLRGEPADIADGNLLLDQLVGAEITYMPARGYNENLPGEIDKLTNQLAEAGEQAFTIPIGASDEIGLWGYLVACDELKADFAEHKITPDYIVSATGSGGTAGGLILGNEVYNLGVEVLSINVCDDEAYFVNKITEDFIAWQARYDQPDFALDLPIRIVEGYVGPGYGIADAQIYATIADLARTEGIILDPVYTGKAFHGLVAELKSGRVKPEHETVFIHTGGIFGIFPHRSHF